MKKGRKERKVEYWNKMQRNDGEKKSQRRIYENRNKGMNKEKNKRRNKKK